MGLRVSVYRDADGSDCTLNGASSIYKEFCVTNIEGPFEPTPDCPAATIEVIECGYKSPYLIPTEAKESGKWVMMGGNYAASSDSRFSKALEAITGYPHPGVVRIHDRCEEWR